MEGHDELAATPMVSVDGFVALPLVGTIKAEGLSSVEFATALGRAYARTIENPRVSTVVLAHALRVSVLGEVTQPGQFLVDSRDGVANALALAGGLTQFADDDAIFVVRSSIPQRVRFRLAELTRGGASATSFRLQDGDLIVVE